MKTAVVDLPLYRTLPMAIEQIKEHESFRTMLRFGHDSYIQTGQCKFFAMKDKSMKMLEVEVKETVKTTLAELTPVELSSLMLTGMDDAN